jgi:hypothetical protein
MPPVLVLLEVVEDEEEVVVEEDEEEVEDELDEVEVPVEPSSSPHATSVARGRRAEQRKAVRMGRV